jgi:hypothetical protein
LGTIETWQGDFVVKVRPIAYGGFFGRKMQKTDLIISIEQGISHFSPIGNVTAKRRFFS